MDIEKLPFNAAAIVIWLPESETPVDSDFFLGDEKSKAPPHPNPEAWWKLG